MDPRRVLPIVTAVACALVVATLAVTLVRPESAAPARPLPAQRVDTTAAPTGPAAILGAWDQRRSDAWATGDAGALARLYADGSQAGQADVRLLRAYSARGLRVEGLTTQVLALDVAHRSSRRLVLVVTDRVVGATAVGGPTPVALPADRASTRRVVLVRLSEGAPWVVAEVRGQDSAAASTSRTSSSSKS